MRTLSSKLFLSLTALFLVLHSLQINAATIVGNGDDGSDLEGSVPVTNGPIYEARAKALSLLQRLNVVGIPTLGTLIPEVAHSGLYLAKKDVNSALAADHGHSDLRGQVFARTFARPHASTRFFPVAEKLDEAQLVALHIHEGLHRALPADVNEDESIVAAIALAITAPEATYDQVLKTVQTVIPKKVLRKLETGRDEDSEEWRYSNVGTTFRQFFNTSNAATFPIYRMQTVHSHIYPFGGIKTPVGFGIEFSAIQGEGNVIRSGPLGLSARMRILNKKGFEIGLLGNASLNTLSNEELKNSPYGRDVFTLGLSTRKNFDRFFVENVISVSAPGESRRTLGEGIEYKYSYGAIADVKIRAGTRLGLFDFGGYLQMHLADYHRLEGGAFSFDSGRYQIFSGGPEVGFRLEPVTLTLNSRFLISSTKDANLDFLGNLMGAGVSQGSVGLTATVAF